MKRSPDETNLRLGWPALREAISRTILEVKSTTIAAASGFWTYRAGTLKMSGTFNFATAWAVALNVLGVGAGGAISALPDFFAESAVGSSGGIPILLTAPMAPLPFSRATVAAPFISPRRRPRIELLDFRKVVQITVPRSSPSR